MDIPTATEIAVRRNAAAALCFFMTVSLSLYLVLCAEHRLAAGSVRANHPVESAAAPLCPAAAAF
jgi:hypothetical protein